MSEIPPPPPPPSSQDPLPGSLPPSGGSPQSQVNGPALALMALAGCYILYILSLIARSMLGWAMSGGGGGWANSLMSGAGLFVGIGFNLVFAGVIFYGAMQMKSLKNYNMALVGSVAAMIPCGCCCFVGIPIGIWSLIVLLKPEVKAAFTNV